MKIIWRRVYGLGFACERLNVVTDDLMWGGYKLACKVYLGPLLVTFSVPISRRHPQF